ncbi:MAG: hypothetical protein Q8P41_31635 [Pseudomonadota bacterium]|nr:hypothetical protein [Pseudomonadota bacterium]
MSQFVEEITLKANDKASNVLAGLTSNLRGFMGQLAGMAGIAGTGFGLATMVKEGIGFNKMLDDSRIAIAAVVGSLHTYRDASGTVIKGEAAWSAALADSAAVQEKLRVAALTTTATYSEMVEAFQVGVGPMTRAGIALNDTAEATQRLTQVAAAASIPMAQLAVEIRQFFNGDVMRGRLLQTLQITKEQIEEHKKLGDMMDFIRVKTETYARAAQAAAETMTGRWSNLKDAIQQTLGVGMEPLYAKLKEAMGELTSQFVTFGKDAKGNLTAAFSPEVIARVKAMGETLTAALDRFKEMIPAVVDFGLAVGEHVSKAIDLLSRLPFKEILSVLTDLIKVTNGWGFALLGTIKVAGGFSAFKTMLMALPGYAHAFMLSLDGLALGIVYTTGASVALGQALALALGGVAAGGALWGIGKIIEGLHVMGQLMDEWEAERKGKFAAAQELESQILRMQDALGKVVGPKTMIQVGVGNQVAGVLGIVRDEMSKTGVVTEKTRLLYLDLMKAYKTVNPNFEDHSGERSPNAMSDEMKAAGVEYEALLKKLREKAELSGLDGIQKKLREIQIEASALVAEVTKKAEAAGTSAAAGLAAIAESATNNTLKALQASTKGFVATPVALWDGVLKKQLDQVKTYVVDTGNVVLKTWDEVRDKMREKAADLLHLFSGDAGAGTEAGFLAIFAAIPTAAESAANAVTGVWQGMARSFDDSFYSVLTGRLDSLKDVFKNLWESVLRTFSQYLSDMLQRWIKTQIQMGETSAANGAAGTASSLPGGVASGGMFGNSTGWGSMGGGYANGGGVGGAAAGAGVGMGIGALIGGLGNGKYNATGGQIGGAIGGAIFGVIGAVVGALIGTLIGALASPNTMQHVKGSLGAMFGSSDWIPDAWQKGPGEKGPGGPGAGDDGGEDVFVPGHWGPGEKAKTELEVAGKEILDKQTSTFADLFRTGAKEQSRELLATYRKTLRESLSGASFDLNAGSSATIQDVTDYLTTKLIPRIGLSAAFGQTGYLPNGNQDKGGIGNLTYAMPGMNPDGTWQEKKLFSEDSPLFKMMVGIKDASGAYADGLGFTVDKFAELAGRISTDDPEKLLAYIVGLVGVVAGLRDLGSEMKKTFSEIGADWQAEIAAGQAVAFGAAADDVKALFENLDLYAGDEQITKAQEALQSSNDLWDSVLSYLSQLNTLADQLSESIQKQRTAMRDFLSPLKDAQKIAGAQGTIDSGWGALLKAQTPEAVNAAAIGMQQALDIIFGLMAERVTRGKALLERIATLDANLGGIGADVAFARLEQESPLVAWGQTMAEIQGKIAAAAKLSGIEQIAALEDVGASAEEMYQNLSSFLAEIANVSASINKSIDSQIWELGVGEMDPTGQASAVTDRIKELQQQLQTATSPAAIAAITSEIQSLTTRYVSQFGKDDPNRAEAIAWAQKELDDSRNLANAALALMQSEAEKLAGELRGMLMGSTGLITTNVNEAATVINQLSQTLSELDRVVREQIARLGTSALDALEPLRIAMEGASAIFTGATGQVVDALVGADVGLEDSAKRASGAFDLAGAAVARFAAKLDGVNVTGSTPASKQSTGAAPVSADQVIAVNRRYGQRMTPRVA